MKIKHENVELTLTQEAYLSTHVNSMGYEFECFRAHAVDADGEEYQVIWEITNSDADEQDEMVASWDKISDAYKI